MITLIHGSHQAMSRNQLQLLKKKYEEVITFDGKNLTLEQLKQALESISLFGQEKLVVIENLWVQKKQNEVENFWSQKKQNEEVVKYFTEFTKTIMEKYNLVFWEEKELKGKNLALLSILRANLLKFNLPSVIFKFLDSLRPKNSKEILFFYKQALQEEEEQLIFYLLVRQIRFLMLIKSHPEADQGPSDFKTLSPWQINKLTNQVRHFTLKKLIDLYQSLEEIDYLVKSGKTELELGEQLKFLLIQKFL